MKLTDEEISYAIARCTLEGVVMPFKLAREIAGMVEDAIVDRLRGEVFPTHSVSGVQRDLAPVEITLCALCDHEDDDHAPDCLPGRVLTAIRRD